MRKKPTNLFRLNSLLQKALNEHMKYFVDENDKNIAAHMECVPELSESCITFYIAIHADFLDTRIDPNFADWFRWTEQSATWANLLVSRIDFVDGMPKFSAADDFDYDQRDDEIRFNDDLKVVNFCGELALKEVIQANGLDTMEKFQNWLTT
jgi:hypothetical protein